MWVVVSGAFLGWALGANDAANVFGPAVSSNIIKFSRAALLSAIFIVIGALLEGHEGLKTVGELTGQTALQALLCMLTAGAVVTVMTVLKLPVSTSQAVIGAIVGAGIVSGDIHWGALRKVIICWVGTPIGAALAAYVLYQLGSFICRNLKLNFFQIDFVIRGGLILCCIYGAYALGANNVANTTGVFVGAGILSPFQGLLIGSLSIALGVLTFSKNVIRTVGRSLVPIDGFSAMICLLASSLTVHFYAIVGVPVSTSQAIVGAVLGIGMIKGLYTVNSGTLLRIGAGWLVTPIFSLLISAALLIAIK